jgi:hypothetical protein
VGPHDFWLSDATAVGHVQVPRVPAIVDHLRTELTRRLARPSPA